MTDLETKPATIEVSVTVTVNGTGKTFNASAQTDGDPHSAARMLLHAVRDDAADWASELGSELERRQDAARRGLVGVR
ncbi:hypothetical protein ACIA5D_36485 [Actinoplanes sp. NPDC051513]|uniref:hypothetical protein n=1 Tax=Actinoplanes sp. NPDC051513 TaxID=3363908 RepID=UPI0037A5C749